MCISVHIISLKFLWFFIPYLSFYLSNLYHPSFTNLWHVYLSSIYLTFYPSPFHCLSLIPQLCLSYFFETKSQSQTHSIILPQNPMLPGCWDCRHEAPFPAQTSYVLNFFLFFQRMLIIEDYILKNHTELFKIWYK